MGKFEYKYQAPTIEERREIDAIRSQYLPKDKELVKLDRLRSLDQKVKNTPLIYSLSFGVIGTLLFGTGMTFFLEWTTYWYYGIPFGIVGIILIILAYPIHKKVYKKMKDKYSEEIIALSNELLNEE